MKVLLGKLSLSGRNQLFYKWGWKPADGVDKPENFASIAGSFNIASAGSYLKDNKKDVKKFQVLDTL